MDLWTGIVVSEIVCILQFQLFHDLEKPNKYIAAGLSDVCKLG